jgi:hypothetical protein
VAAAPGAWATLSTAMESAPTEATKTTTANTEGTNDDGARLTGGAMRVQVRRNNALLTCAKPINLFVLRILVSAIFGF